MTSSDFCLCDIARCPPKLNAPEDLPGFIRCRAVQCARHQQCRRNSIWGMNGNFLEMLLGLGAEPKDLNLVQVSIRGIIVMIAALIMIRLGSKRSLAQKTVYDAVLIVVLASMLARAINGSAALW